MSSTDISDRPTASMQAVRFRTRTTKPCHEARLSWLPRNRGFWLRVFYLIVILAIEGTALGLLFFTIALPKIDAVNSRLDPTAPTYQCVHAVLIRTGPGQYITKTDYVCH